MSATTFKYESDEFNHEFKVLASERDHAFTLIDPGMIQWLLASARDCHLEIVGYMLILAAREKPWEQMGSFAELAMEFEDRIPPLAFERYGGAVVTGIDIEPWLGLAVIVLVGAWWLAVYNRLVELRQLIANSWSNVETELKRRYELIPRLVETVKGYAEHERSVFESVVAARSAAVATNTENRIQLARWIYNANMRDHNVLIESVPSNLVASAGGFERSSSFEVSPVESQAPEVDLNP